MLSLLRKHEHLDFRGNYFFGRFFKLSLVPENLWFYIIPPYGG